jgi:hypothetical protein
MEHCRQYAAQALRGETDSLVAGLGLASYCASMTVNYWRLSGYFSMGTSGFSAIMYGGTWFLTWTNLTKCYTRPHRGRASCSKRNNEELPLWRQKS